MTTNILHGSNISEHHWMSTTLKRFSALGRGFRNTFTPNPENESFNKMKSVHRAATLERFQKRGGALEVDKSCLKDRAKTLGKKGERSSEAILESLSALEQAKQFFAEGQGNFSLESSSSLHTLASRVPNEMSRELEQAKESFRDKSYKKAKKRFKKVLQSGSLGQEKTTVKLYLVTICLLLNNKREVEKYRKAKECLKEEVVFYRRGSIVSLTQAMYAHLDRLIKEREDPKSIKGPFLIPQLYEKAEGFSKDEKVMAKALYEKFHISKALSTLKCTKKNI